MIKECQAHTWFIYQYAVYIISDLKIPEYSSIGCIIFWYVKYPHFPLHIVKTIIIYFVPY